MPLVEKYQHGVPCWVDLVTTDLAAAKKFYTGLFGWTYIDKSMGEMGIGTYSMAMVDDVATAAIYEIGPDQLRSTDKPVWHVYISVDDIKTVLEGAQKNDGIVLVGATDVDQAGRVSVIEDPTGCRTTVWQPGEFHGSGIRAEPGAFTWTEHASTDRARSVLFYEKVLNVDTVTSSAGHSVEYSTLVVDDVGVAGVFQMPDRMIDDGAPSQWYVYFQVRDLDASIEYAEANGGKAMAEAPEEIGVGRVIVLRDPQDADFCIVEPYGQ